MGRKIVQFTDHSDIYYDYSDQQLHKADGEAH